MNSDRDSKNSQLEAELQELTTLVWSIAGKYKGDSPSSLFLLRILERLHREIREQIFEPSLPDTRSSLFHLLREIEETGGWPYIERMKLQTFLTHLLKNEEGFESEAEQVRDGP
jgi:hypothetical protein